ncbi:hypothetical protein D3C87_1759470 [compost metagenome]
MRNPIALTLPFTTPVGTVGAVHLQHNDRCEGKPRLSITVGHIINGSSADAHLSIETMHQLVDGLMDCICALERKERIHSVDTDGGGHE